MCSDTGLFYTFIFSPNTVNLHAGSDLSTRGLFPSPLPFFFTTIGRGPLSPLELNVGLFFYTVFRPICVPLLPFVSTGWSTVWILHFTQQDVWPYKCSVAVYWKNDTSFGGYFTLEQRSKRIPFLLTCVRGQEAGSPGILTLTLTVLACHCRVLSPRSLHCVSFARIALYDGCSWGHQWWREVSQVQWAGQS